MLQKIRLLFLISCGFHTGYTQPDTLPVFRASFFFLNAGYRVHVNQQRIINSGNGLALELGINPGKFINDRLMLGIYGGWAWRDGLWSTGFKDRFVADYKHAINPEAGFSGLDSALISASQNLFASKKGRSAALPGCETKTFNNYSLYVGFMLKLPSHFMPVIKLYAGRTNTFYRGSGVITDKTDYNSFSLSRPMKGCEVMLRSRDILKQRILKKYPALGYMALSVYLEIYDFEQASLKFDDGHQRHTIAFSRFTNHAFIGRYHNDQAFGIRLSVLLM